MIVPARLLRLLGLRPRTYIYQAPPARPAKPADPQTLQALSRACKVQAYYDRHNHPAGWTR
jgi:hypothetical protein